MPTARISLVFLAAFVPLFAAQQTNTVAGEFVVEPPTLVFLGFDWKISGDDNRNARVERFLYGGFDRAIAAYGTPFDGTYYLTQSAPAIPCNGIFEG